jgi:hypothetical protein
VFALLEILIRPAKVYARVRYQKNWIAPFLGVLFLSMLSVVLVIETAGIELLTLQRYQHNPKLAEKIGGDRGVERAISSSNERWSKLLVVSRSGGAAAVGMVLLAAAFTAAVAMFDRKPNFLAMLGTVSFSLFPFALLGLVITAVMLTGSLDHSVFDLENMPGLNFGRLLDRGASNPAIFAMASEMDVLLLGQTLLMSFGLTRVTSVTLAQSLAICGSIWALVVLWKAAWVMYI